MPSGIFQEAILVPVTRVRVVGSGIEGGADVLEDPNPSYTSTGSLRREFPYAGCFELTLGEMGRRELFLLLLGLDVRLLGLAIDVDDGDRPEGNEIDAGN